MSIRALLLLAAAAAARAALRAEPAALTMQEGEAAEYRVVAGAEAVTVAVEAPRGVAVSPSVFALEPGAAQTVSVRVPDDHVAAGAAEHTVGHRVLLGGPVEAPAVRLRVEDDDVAGVRVTKAAGRAVFTVELLSSPPGPVAVSFGGEEVAAFAPEGWHRPARVVLGSGPGSGEAVGDWETTWGELEVV